MVVGYTQTPLWCGPRRARQSKGGVTASPGAQAVSSARLGPETALEFPDFSSSLFSSYCIFFYKQLVNFYYHDFSFPFFLSLLLFPCPLFSVFYLSHFFFFSPECITSLPLPARRAGFLPIAPSLLFPASLQAWFRACWNQLQVCDYKNNKIHFTFGNKRSGLKTCFFSHLLQRTPWLGRLFFSKHSAQNRHLLQRE